MRPTLRRRSSLSPVLAGGLLTLFVFALSACGPRARPELPVTPPALPADSASGLQIAYNEAVRDALNPEPDEVVDDLIAIRFDNQDLVWLEFEGASRLLTVSVVADTSFYTEHVGQAYDTGTHYIWVTAAPELQTTCNAPAFGPDIGKLRQLLGLTPTSEVTAMVEFWVTPDQLFRPAPDPEIDDSTAGLILADDVEPWYREWFNQLRAHQYFQSRQPPNDAYPWTQLGYTYNWGSSDTEQGLSEFVIKLNESVIVNAIRSVQEYCG